MKFAQVGVVMRKMRKTQMKLMNQGALFQLALLGILLALLGLFGFVGNITHVAAMAIGLVVSVVRQWAGGWKPIGVKESIVWGALGMVLLIAETFTSGLQVSGGEPGKVSLMGAAFVGVGISGLLVRIFRENK